MSDANETLEGIEQHPHARAVLLPALAPAGSPSHAYLFHGPAGAGKRTVARAFAAALLAEDSADSTATLVRVQRGTHPDLTWVTPSGASELLVGDIDEAVVGAVAHTPFESQRRVFVIEGAGTMNDQAANRLLKTLEEPPAFAHLILLAEHREDVLPTVASRCQAVRFDPLAAEEIERRLVSAGPALSAADAAQPVDRALDRALLDPARARACARLSGGDAQLAERLAGTLKDTPHSGGQAGEEGAGLREAAEGYVRAALSGRTGERPWGMLLEGATAAGAAAGAACAERVSEQAQLLPSRERRRHEREGADAVRRAERRARTQTLQEAMRLVELWLRDAWCVAQGAGELVLAVDRLAELEDDARGRTGEALREGVELVRDTRLRLALNVSEELALEALAYRLAELLGAGG
jgi:DNA polymerase-3 subunit delta'